MRSRARWGAAALADRETSQVVGVGTKVEKFTLKSWGPCEGQEGQNSPWNFRPFHITNTSYLDQEEKNRSLSWLAIFILDLKISLYFLFLLVLPPSPPPLLIGRKGCNLQFGICGILGL